MAWENVVSVKCCDENSKALLSLIRNYFVPVLSAGKMVLGRKRHSKLSSRALRAKCISLKRARSKRCAFFSLCMFVFS